MQAADRRDLTQGSLPRLILSLSLPAAVSMLAQIAYQMVDLYFIARLGAVPTAGVNAAGTLIWVVNALTQILSVSTIALVSRAAGRRDHHESRLVFNQGLLLATACGTLFLILGVLGARTYLQIMTAHPATIEAGVSFLYAVLPGFALQLPMAVASAGLRGAGVVNPPIAIYTGTVLLNMILAPVLIAGWGTNIPLGVVGGGYATSISVVCGMIAMVICIRTSRASVDIRVPLMRPRIEQWRKMLRIGLPAGGEFALLFLSSALIYATIERFGPSAQAGFAIGSRILQALLLPAVAVAFAATPIVGQSFGAQNMARLRAAFRTLVILECVITLGLFSLLQLQPHALMALFNAESDSAAIGHSFLKIVSCGLFFQASIYICMAMFQGLGQTLPSLLSSAARFGALAIGAMVLSAQPAFEPEHLWLLMVASTALQAILGYSLLRRRLQA